MKKYYQVIVLMVLSFFADASVTTSRTDVQAEILHVNKKLKTDDSFPSLNNVILSPITFDREDFYMALGELTIEGLENMSIKKLSPSLYNLSMSVAVLVPELSVRADFYHLTVGQFLPWMGFIKLVDDVGELRCYINNIAVRGTVQFGTNDDGDTDIINLDLVYSIREFKVELSGSAFWVNHVANRNALKFLNNEDLVDIVTNLVKDRTRPHLQGYKPLEFIRMIKNNVNLKYIMNSYN